MLKRNQNKAKKGTHKPGMMLFTLERAENILLNGFRVCGENICKIVILVWASFFMPSFLLNVWTLKKQEPSHFFPCVQIPPSKQRKITHQCNTTWWWQRAWNLPFLNLQPIFRDDNNNLVQNWKSETIDLGRARRTQKKNSTSSSLYDYIFFSSQLLCSGWNWYHWCQTTLNRYKRKRKGKNKLLFF